jgi:hypothetical protein
MDSLLRTVGGSTVNLRVAGPNPASDQLETGAAQTAIENIPLAPAAMRKLRPQVTAGQPCQVEILISASAVEVQVSQLQLSSADALFASALGVEVGGKLFLIEALTASEAFGQVYLYRLLVREAQPES